MEKQTVQFGEKKFKDKIISLVPYLLDNSWSFPNTASMTEESTDLSLVESIQDCKYNTNCLSDFIDVSNEAKDTKFECIYMFDCALYYIHKDDIDSWLSIGAPNCHDDFMTLDNGDMIASVAC